MSLRRYLLEHKIHPATPNRLQKPDQPQKDEYNNSRPSMDYINRFIDGFQRSFDEPSVTTMDAPVTPFTTIDPVPKSKDAHRRDPDVFVFDSNQHSEFHWVDYEGKDIPSERTDLVLRHRIPHKIPSATQLSHSDSSEITRSFSPSLNDADADGGAEEDEDENKDEDEYENKEENEDQTANDIPVIPYHISALDLAVHDNDPFQLLRTHGSGGAGKHIKKLNDRRMSTEHRKHGAPGFTKKIRLPRCRFGTGRMLDHPRDDPGREVCWFHKQNVDKWDKKCEKW